MHVTQGTSSPVISPHGPPTEDEQSNATNLDKTTVRRWKTNPEQSSPDELLNIRAHPAMLWAPCRWRIFLAGRSAGLTLSSHEQLSGDSCELHTGNALDDWPYTEGIMKTTKSRDKETRWHRTMPMAVEETLTTSRSGVQTARSSPSRFCGAEEQGTGS